MNRLHHVGKHLRERDRPFLPYFLLPLTHSEIAVQMGPGWTRRQVETSWMWVKVSMGLRDTRGGHGHDLNRLELLRMCTGVDPCICERLASELVDKAA